MAKHKYEIVVGKSYATAEAAAKSAQLKANASGGEVIGIAADAMCCGGRGVRAGLESEGGVAPGIPGRPGTVEWDVYVPVRH